jgi:hypothetical protein
VNIKFTVVLDERTTMLKPEAVTFSHESLEKLFLPIMFENRLPSSNAVVDAQEFLESGFARCGRWSVIFVKFLNEALLQAVASYLLRSVVNAP